MRLVATLLLLATATANALGVGIVRPMPQWHPRFSRLSRGGNRLPAARAAPASVPPPVEPTVDTGAYCRPRRS